MAHKPYKINELFSIVANSPLVSTEDCQSIYNTIRETLRIKNILNFRNNVDAMLNNEELFNYFVENFDRDISAKHLENIITLNEVFHHYLNESDDDTKSEDQKSLSSEESDDDSDDDSDEEDITLEVKCDTSDVEDVVIQQHGITRWLVGANTILGFGNMMITTFLAVKVIDMYRQLSTCNENF